jgi:hypothetical protein
VPESSAVTSLPSWALVPQIAALLAALIVGARMLKIALRTRGWPEIALGAFLVGQGVGAVLEAVAVAMPAGAGFAHALAALGKLIVVSATIALYIATWRMFRAKFGWARALAIGGSVFLVVVWVVGLFDRGPIPVPTIADTSPGTLVLLAVQLGAFGWWTVESALYVARLNRQRALGLVSPLVVRRCALWVACGICGAVGVAAVLSLAAARVAPQEVPSLWAGLALVFLVGTLGAYVSFLNPGFLQLGSEQGSAAGG